LRSVTKQQASTPEAYVERVNLAIDHVVRNLVRPLRLKTVAKAARLSPYHFHRVFQAMMEETLADFVKRLRLERALTMMAFPPAARSRRLAISTIAARCGFTSSSDFSRSFRRRYRAAPSAFDIQKWRKQHAGELEWMAAQASERRHLKHGPAARNPDGFTVRIRELPARTVAYIRVRNPYAGDAVVRATLRLIAWAERGGFADGQWLGYQWENPEITSLAQCQYFMAVEVPGERFTPGGEIGRCRFPPMLVAQVEIKGSIELELRALQWLYGTWLVRSGYVPDDQPGFEAFIGRPFAHGLEYFELHAQLPIRAAGRGFG
jgi:AraC family transcriptional regulator